MVVYFRKMLREKESTEVQFRELRGKRDDVYRALRTRNAMENL